MKAVLTGDLVESSYYTPKVLTEVLEELKLEFKWLRESEYKAGTFAIWRGDSFQGTLPVESNAMQVALILISKVMSTTGQNMKVSSKPIASVRIGVGIGSADRQKDNIEESSGDVFRYSGQMLDMIKSRKMILGFQSPVENFNQEFFTQMVFLNLLINQWSIASAEVVYYLLKGLKEKQIAERLSISQPSVNMRKKAAGWEAIEQVVNRYGQIINQLIT